MAKAKRENWLKPQEKYEPRKPLEITRDTWIISDTHFNHANIVKYCNRPVYHTDLIRIRWNHHIKVGDTVLHLGDVFMGRQENSVRIMRNLPGNIWFIRGNHDKKSIDFYHKYGFKHAGDADFGDVGKKLNAAFVVIDDVRILFSHYPDEQWTDQWDINIHGHIHNNGYPGGTPMLDYRNVSVEVTDYRPVKLGDILDGVGPYESRASAPTWTGQTREGERKMHGKVALPTVNEIGYYGESDG